MIDSIKIHFSADNLLVLNICLALIMFGIALDMNLRDFKNLFKAPKPVIVGITAQLLIAPVVTLMLVYVFNPPPSVALGMVAISACPGGNNSNYSTHLAKGNTALAVTTTSLSVLACIITLPFYIWLGAKIISFGDRSGIAVSLGFTDMLKIVVTLILMPLAIGMYVGSIKNNRIEQFKKPFKIFSQILFFGLIIAAIISNFQNIVQYVQHVFLIVLVLNAAALASGYFFGKLNGLKEADCRALSFETGIHNVTLALIIIFNFFGGLGGMALVAAWYGIWDLITGFSLAMLWSRKRIV